MLIGLAATSGGEGDNQILLWNVQSGQLASDLNLGYRLVVGFTFTSFQGSTLLATFGASDNTLTCKIKDVTILSCCISD